jgi:hypothetical protein
VISAILCCCCHAILSSSVLCLFFFRKAMIHFTLRFFSSCLVLCVCDGRFFFFSFPSPVDPPFPVGGFFFFRQNCGVFACCAVTTSKKKSRVSPPCPLLCSSYTLSDPFPRHPGNKTQKIIST